MEFKAIIPKNIDPIKLADKIKGNLTTAWLKRRAKTKSLNEIKEEKS